MYVMILAALLLATGREPPAAAEPPYRLVDLTAAYADFHARTEGMETADRVAALKAEFSEIFPGFYDDARLAGVGISADDYNAWIARSFEEFPALRADYERTAAAFADMLAPAHASFLETFPDLAPIGDIYLIHSVAEMDGGTRNLGGRVVLVFGADQMAQHPLDDWTPFFHHELFHVYHFQQSFMGCPKVWCFLWVEGVATYAAAALNPDATDAELLLVRPEPIRKAVDANLDEAVCAVAARLESGDSADYRALFSSARLNERLPPRFGYYVGMLAAGEAARETPLPELARLSGEEVRPLLERALARLAACDAGGP